MNGKAAVNSKTIIFNLLATVVLLLEAAPAFIEAMAELYTVPGWVLPATAYALVAGNIIIRVWATEKPITGFLKAKF